MTHVTQTTCPLQPLVSSDETLKECFLDGPLQKLLQCLWFTEYLEYLGHR